MTMPTSGEINFNDPQNRPPPNEDEESDHDSSNKKLDYLVESAKEPLLRIRTAIPLNPFPTEIIVDVNKVDIVCKQFFASEQVHSIVIKKLADVVAETSLIFATIKLIHVNYPDHPVEVRYLKKEDAIKAKRVIEGLIVAHRSRIKLENIESEELAEKMEHLGATPSLAL